MQQELNRTDAVKSVIAIVVFVLGARLLTITLLGHPVSFAPMNALALFCGAYLGARTLAYLLPFAAIVVSDQVINYMFYGSFVPLYPGWYWQYACYALFVAIGVWYQPSRSALRVAGVSVASSILFFLISNFGVWFSTTIYPPTIGGLEQCFIMGLPFMRQSMIADLFFCALFFGSFELVHRTSRRTVSA